MQVQGKEHRNLMVQAEVDKLLRELGNVDETFNRARQKITNTL